MKEISRKGTLRKVSLPRILVSLNKDMKTGTLVVKTPSFTKNVFIVKGEAIFASSSHEDDRLGEMLIKAGKINLEQYKESVRLLKQTDKRQGSILVELGYLSQKDLFWGVKYQVKEIICSLFVLEDGSYEFIEGEIPSQEVITLKIGMNNLIYEGIQKINNWTRIRNEIPPEETVPKLSEDAFMHLKGIELSRQEKKMLSLIDNTKNMKEIIDRAKVNTFEGMRFFYILWTIGAIKEKIIG
jgi:Domain of unknown function (DUF4388)